MTKAQLTSLAKYLKGFIESCNASEDLEVQKASHLVLDEINRRLNEIEEEKKRQKAEEKKKKDAEKAAAKAAAKAAEKASVKKGSGSRKKKAEELPADSGAEGSLTVTEVQKAAKAKTKAASTKLKLEEQYDLIDKGELETAFSTCKGKEASFIRSFLDDREAVLSDTAFPTEYYATLTANGIKLILYSLTKDRQNSAMKSSAKKDAAFDALKHAVLMERRRMGMRIDI